MPDEIISTILFNLIVHPKNIVATDHDKDDNDK